VKSPVYSGPSRLIPGIFVLLTALLWTSLSYGGDVNERAFFEENFESIQMLARNYQQRWYEGIRVTGTEGFSGRIVEALALVEDTDTRNWYYVRKHIRKITLTGHPGMDVANGRLMSGGLAGESAVTAAGGIVHEAWHRELHFRGADWSGREAERLCIEKQNAFLSLLGAPPLNVEETLASEFWKVDYWSRDW
jgi:hypothetical protein